MSLLGKNFFRELTKKIEIIITCLGWQQENKLIFSSEIFLGHVCCLYLFRVVHPKLDLVNVVVRPFLFTKSSIFTKWSLDKE